MAHSRHPLHNPDVENDLQGTDPGAYETDPGTYERLSELYGATLPVESIADTVRRLQLADDPEALLRTVMDELAVEHGEGTPERDSGAISAMATGLGSLLGEAAAQLDLAAEHRYCDLHPIGAGATGTVYSATDTHFHRDIAIKLIHREHAGNIRSLGRFIQEARVTARLEHPNILPVYDLDATDDGRLFFTMRRANGTTLAEILERWPRGDGPPPDAIADPERAIGIIRPVCDALAYAHDQGIIHQDIKPANIMIGRFNEVLLVDWGTALLPEDREQGHFSIMGTPFYMAPEQARGETVDERSDVYAIGATLFQLLTSHPPIWSSHIDTFWEHKRKGILTPLPPRVRGRVHPELMDICLTALAPVPERRYQSVRSLLAALDAFAEHATSALTSQRGFAHLQEASGGADYPVLNQAIATFNRALDLWPENPTAIVGLQQSRQALARHAISHGDLALASAQIGELPDRMARPLDEAVDREQRRRSSAALRIRMLSGLVVAGMVLVIALLWWERVEPAAHRSQQWLPVARIDPAEAAEIPAELSTPALLWLPLEPQRDDVRVDVEMSWPQEVDGFEILIDASYDPGIGGSTPRGALAQFGGYHNQMHFISALERPGAPTNLDRAPSDMRTGQRYTLSFARSGDRLLQYIDGRLINSLLNITPLGGPESGMVALRCWSEARIHSVTVSHRGTKESSRLDVPDALFAHGLYDAAYRSYLAIAADTRVPHVHERSLARAYIAAGHSATVASRRQAVLARLRRDFPRSPYLVACIGAEAVTLWEDRQHRPALERAEEALDRGGSPSVVQRLLASRHRHLAEDNGLRLLRLVARSPGLTRVDLSGYGLQDLSPLAGVPLQNLTLSDNAITDLAPLRGMPLLGLDLNRNPVTDLAPLANCLQLTRLRCAHTGIVDLTPLAELSLTELDVNDTHVSDLTPLAGAPIGSLDISRTGIDSLTPLANAPLGVLKASGSALSSLTSLRGLPLRSLDISYTAASDLTPLAGAPLVSLRAVGTPVADLRPLTDSPLRTLALGHHPISDLAPLAHLPLTTLSLHDAGVESCQHIAASGLLNHLSLQDNHIVDPEPLLALHLESLDLRGNPITDVTALAAFSPSVLRVNWLRLQPTAAGELLRLWSVQPRWSAAVASQRLDRAVAEGDRATLVQQARPGPSGRRYLLVPHAYSFAEAEATAIRLGAVLACPSDPEAAELVKSVSRNQAFWIGLVPEDGRWQWMNGDALQWVRWRHPVNPVPSVRWARSFLFNFMADWTTLDRNRSQAGVVLEWGAP